MLILGVGERDDPRSGLGEPGIAGTLDSAMPRSCIRVR